LPNVPDAATTIEGSFNDDAGGKRRRHAKKPATTSSTTPSGGVSTPTPPAKRLDANHSATTTPIMATHHHPASSTVAVDLVVLVTRTDLSDAAQANESSPQSPPPPTSWSEESGDVLVLPSSSSLSAASSSLPGYPRPNVAPYAFHPNTNHNGIMSNNGTIGASDMATTTDLTLAICRVPPSKPVTSRFWMEQAVFDKATMPPATLLLDRSIHKYWKQRRRLFSRFDLGIQLDAQGWFSVTPEQIADHVAVRTLDLYRTIQQALSLSQPPATTQQRARGMIVLDAFCGCGGNSIAFAKQDGVDLVVCVDIDRTKLQRAANNASIYEIPTQKLVFIECNVLFLLEHCYKNGSFILDQPIETQEKAMAMMSAMPPPVETETCHGYSIGGIDMLPREVDAVFMDPPWGGVDYEIFGKNGYCLERNMRIPRPANQIPTPPPPVASGEGVADGFFDTFCVSTSQHTRNRQERKAAFNCGLDENNCVNGAELLALAAHAAMHAQVVYDIPRNTSRTSLGQAALAAGYRGNCKLEEYYLNGRLKTVSAYFGTDWRSDLLSESPME
jgi:trimethylguanosine synthase